MDNNKIRMKWQQRTFHEVLATRLAFRSKTIPFKRASRTKGEDESSADAFLLRRAQLGNDQKVEAAKYLERKCRVSFQQPFGIQHFQWIITDRPILLEHNYDPLTHSYYLFTGRITIISKHSLCSQGQTMSLEGETGLGYVFNEELYRKAKVSLEVGTVLRISHSGSLLQLIHRNCLMTLRQKQQAVGKLKLFSPLENFSKNFLPYFQPKRYCKGDPIYLIGSEANELFIIVEGIVAFESEITQNGDFSSPLPKVTPKKQLSTLVTTETISKGGFFGQEEVLAHTNRHQNAKCTSMECLLLAVPLEKLHRMLLFPEFKRNLQLSAVLKQQAREKQIKSIIKIHKQQETVATPSPEQAENFNKLKSAIYVHLSPSKQDKPFPSRYAKQRKRVLHNHSLSTSEALPARVKPSNFSMLSVNKAMYDKTLLRFRYSLKEIQKEAQRKQPTPPARGRSLEEIWRTLRLEKSFNPEEVRIVVQGDGEEGMACYQAYQRLAKQIKNTKCLRPKTLNCSNKLKSQYIQYLNIAL